jgi:predicted nuclease with TOPRIM domain
MIDAAKKFDAQIGQSPSQPEVESCLLALAAAFRDLIAERNRLRSRVEAQEGELKSVNATNADLRRQITLIAESCKKLATSLVKQLQHIDDAEREAALSHYGAARTR